METKEFKCQVCADKSMICEEVARIKELLSEVDLNLSTDLWKHNTSSMLIVAKRRIDYLLNSHLIKNTESKE